MPDSELMVRRQRVLANFGEFALRSESLDEVLMEACRLVGEALGTERAKVLEIERGDETLLVRAGVGWHPDIVGKLRLPMAEHSSETFAIKAAKPVITQDIQKEDRFEVPPFMKEAGVVALTNVPVFLPGGKPYGLLQVDDTKPREFGEEDTEFLRTYATILGPVIDRLHKISRLRQTEERFRLIVESALDYAIVVTDAEDRITDWLPGAEAVFGWTREEAVGQSSSSIFTPEDRAAGVDEDEVETARREGVAPNRRWHIRKDGARVFIDGTVTALRGEGGEVRGFLKIGQDVTERRAVEERQRALLEGMPQLVWRSAASGRWNWAGRQWTEYTGLSDAESRDRGWLAAVHPEDREGAVSAWERATQASGLFEADYRLRRAGDGAWRWFQTRGVPVRGVGDNVVEWFGTSTDVDDQFEARQVLAQGRKRLEAEVAARTAELMKAEESLRQAQKMEAVGQLTGGIAHDFNNMLQGVVGGLAMARRQIGAGHPEGAERYLAAAHGAAERAAGLTRRLLAFARRQRLEARLVDADRLVAGLADLIRRTVGPGIAVELRLRDGAGSVLCDPNELESALVNLCINARDAMPEGGRLAIGTEEVRLSAPDIPKGEAPPGTYVALSVADTGTGMPPELLDRVFEPFFTTKPQGQGTGLGLSQVYGFVRQSGGLVRIESAPGRGTTVRLLLPLHEGVAAAAEGARPSASLPIGMSGSVLMVDDEDVVRGPAAGRLRELGLTVLEARDGPEALQVLASARPDLLVTDVGLPGGMNGRQVAEAARERVRGLPVLFITGYAGTALPTGMEVIGKPFELETLARRVEAILRAGRRGSDSDPAA
jgi:PAS domain S-box-containing protein